MGDSDGEKRQIAANRLFKMADDATPGARRLRLVRAGYHALRRAMAIDQTISLGAPYPGWKQLQAYYRKRLDATCAETNEEKAARKAILVAKKEFAQARSWNRESLRTNLIDAQLKYAGIVGMTVRL